METTQSQVIHDQDNFCDKKMAEIEADIQDTKSALAELSKDDEILFISTQTI